MECNPLAFDTEQMDGSVVMYQILEEVRSLKERVEKNDEENKNLLEKLRDDVKTLRAEIKEMKMYADPEFKLLPNMPFDTLEELREFDESLPQDDALRNELKAFLIRLAGHDFASFLRTALRAIVTDELAINLTWRGTPEKPSVQSFTVFVLLRDLCHGRFSHSTHADINRICQQHFLHAKDRVTKKQKSTGSGGGTSFSSHAAKRPSSSNSSLVATPPPATQQFLNLPLLPLTTLQGLEEFDEKLLHDIKTKSALKKFVNGIEGMEYSVFLRAAFKAVITDNVAMELTWRGTKEKPSVQDFVICDVIKDICQKKFDEVPVMDINRICQQHIHHAKDRVSKRGKFF